jgi:Arc/MetJ family transcription regulator
MIDLAFEWNAMMTIQRRETMKTNVDLDDLLLAEAMKISGMTTKKAVLELALKEYLRKNNIKKILRYRGKNIWEGNLEEIRAAR